MWYAILIFGFLIWLVDVLDKRSIKRSTDRVAASQRKLYEFIDSHYGPYEARKKKEDAELFVHAYWEQELHRDYKPDGVDEVTTKASRKRIIQDRARLAAMPERYHATGDMLAATFAAQAGITPEQYRKNRERLLSGRNKDKEVAR